MSLLAKEWKALVSNRKVLVPVLAVLFIPLMYAGMFLWAFWDPYEQLDQLPVAVVNEDSGADYEGTDLKIGSELVDNLKDNPKFKWDFVSKNEAEKGLENEQYYMMIEIPENFSKNATTLMDEKPQSLELKYVPNEGYNFLSGQIGGTAVAQIKEEVSNTLTKTYAESIFENIDKLADGIGEASDGASKINNGVGDLKEGSFKLKENLQVLAEKSITFKDGLNDASAGSKELTSGLTSLDSGLGQLQEGGEKLYSGSVQAEQGTVKLNEGLSASLAGMKQLQESAPQLTDGSAQLSSGAEQLSNKLNELSKGNEAAAAGAAELSAGLSTLNEQLAVMLPQIEKLPLPDAEKQKLKEAALGVSQLSEGSKQLEGSLGQLSAGASELGKGAATLSEKSGQLAAGQTKAEGAVNQLVSGQEALYDGSTQIMKGQQQLSGGLKTFGEKLAEAKEGSAQLAAGGGELNSGIAKLADGSSSLQDGTNQLADGAGQLDDGAQELSEGTGELSSKLGDAADETKDTGGSDDVYEMISDPVKVKDEKVNAVPNYGTGFAPYFLSLGLFVGALLLSIVFPLRQSADVPKSGLGWFMSKFGILAVIGVIQALLADAVLLYGLNIEVQSVPYFILFSIITSLTFITLVQFLVTSLGDPGRFVAIIILILQLTTSAGTFPLELIPNALQIFNAWLPMTYSVSGFKAVISSGDFEFMWQQAGILAIFIGAMMIGTIAYFSFAIRKNKSDEMEEAAV